MRFLIKLEPTKEMNCDGACNVLAIALINASLLKRSNSDAEHPLSSIVTSKEIVGTA
jgi:hypothetical protein